MIKYKYTMKEIYHLNMDLISSNTKKKKEV